MSIVTVGIDFAKNVFALHGVDDSGKSVLVKPKVAQGDLAALIAQLPPCMIGMEACSGAHHWARLFRQFGHTVRLMASKFVSTGLGCQVGRDSAIAPCSVTSPCLDPRTCQSEGNRA